jgi:sulfite dehydrogenase (cytochrome) subunit B
MSLERLKTIALLAACALPLAALGQEPQIILKEGAGRDKVAAYCSACHSLDYIQINSPFPDKKLWEAEVNKMVGAFGAPIPKEAVPAIVEYLAQQYGKP